MPQDDAQHHISGLIHHITTLQEEISSLREKLAMAQHEIAELRRGVGISVLIDGKVVMAGGNMRAPDVLPTPIAALHTSPPLAATPAPGLFNQQPRQNQPQEVHRPNSIPQDMAKYFE